MAQKATLKSIASDLNLSVGTVSRVLNGKAKQYRISKKTVELVVKYANDKGYAPNVLAYSIHFYASTR